MRLLLALMALALAFLAGGMPSSATRSPLPRTTGVVAVGEGTAPESAGGAAGAMELASLIPRAEELDGG